jgi:hypothetical protein
MSTVPRSQQGPYRCRKGAGALALILAGLITVEPALAARPRGSVHGAGRGANVQRHGNTTSWQGRRGNASGSRTVTRDGDSATINKNVQTRSGASRSVTKDVDFDDGRVDSVERQSTATNRYGQTVDRERTAEREGAGVKFEGEARTSTGRAANVEGVAGRDVYGRPAVAANVDTRYRGDYSAAAVKGPYGGGRAVVAGPGGTRVVTQLPSGYRTTSYYGRPYYHSGGIYYRPYYYGGHPYYYPIPPPYYMSYSYVPVGAVMLVVAGATYYAAENSYYQKTTGDQGQVVYQTVPAPTGAALTVLPPERVLVTLAGTTYYLSGSAFYRRTVVNGQDRFVVVTAPDGVVMVPALPPDFEVVQLNTMYFMSQGTFYVPYLSPDGKELYVVVDAPPAPPAAGQAAAAAAGEPATRSVAQSFTVPAGTAIPVRLAADLSSVSNKPGDRFQGYLDQDLRVAGRLVAARGGRVYGRVVAVQQASKMKGQHLISAELTDIQVGSRVVSVQTQPVQAKGEAGTGRKKILGGAMLGTAIGAIADGGEGAAKGAAIGGGVGVAATAASSPDAALLSSQSVLQFETAVPFTAAMTVQVAVN